MILLVPTASGRHVNRAVVAELLVIVASDGPAGRVQLNELSPIPRVLVTETVIESILPRRIFVSLIGLIDKGSKAWAWTRAEQSISPPTSEIVRTDFGMGIINLKR